MIVNNDVISIAGLSKALLLSELFNKSHQQGMGYIDRSGAGYMTVDQADAIIRERVVNGEDLYFDYLKGRLLKVDITGDELTTWLYDRENGEGSASEVVKHVSMISAE